VPVVEGDGPVVGGLADRGAGLVGVAPLDGAGLDQGGVDLVADAPEAADREGRVRADPAGGVRRRQSRDVAADGSRATSDMAVAARLWEPLRPTGQGSDT
jgi:hypothetical protein